MKTETFRTIFLLNFFFRSKIFGFILVILKYKMGLLGKTLKGRSSKPQKETGGVRKRIIRPPLAVKTEEEKAQDQAFIKIKRENLKSSYADESKITAFNKKKILTEWRRIMRISKTDDLKKEIEIYSQNHEREVDAKDAVMQMFNRDLEEAEEQYQMALRNNRIHIDELIDIQTSRLQAVEEEFNRDLRIVIEEFEMEREDIMENHRLECKELRDIIAKVDKEEMKKDEEAKSNFETYREEVRNRSNEDLLDMTTRLQYRVLHVDNEFELHHTNYQQKAKKVSEDFQDQLNTNKNDKKEIDNNNKTLDQINDQIASKNYNMQKLKKETDARNAALERERANIHKHYTTLKKKMLQFRETEVRRLKDLTNNSRKCATSLKDKASQGERILKTAELCRKLETEKEKVLPFYQSDPEAASQEDQLLQMDRDKAEAVEETKSEIKKMLNPEEAFDEYTALQNFFKRYNKVYLDKLAIEKQKKQLEKENMFFKSLLKQYLDGVSVNEDVMSAPNPLLVVNNRIDLSRPPVDQVEAIPVIEGNIEINNILRQ